MPELKAVEIKESDWKDKWFEAPSGRVMPATAKLYEHRVRLGLAFCKPTAAEKKAGKVIDKADEK